MNPNILSTINEYVLNQLDAKGVEYKDVLNNGRKAISISGGTEHRAIIGAITSNPTFSQDDLDKMLSSYDITVLDHRDNYYSPNPPYYNCRDWAFDTLHIPKYSFREDRDEANLLLDMDLEHVKYISEPKIDSLALYFDFSDIDKVEAMHWGIVKQIQDEFIIHSKWGNNHVFEHSLFSLPYGIGNGVMFFDKK